MIDTIAVRAFLDPQGGMPEEAHHILTRGRAPALILDPQNQIGLSRRYHAYVQEHPLEPLPDAEARADLHNVWSPHA